MRVRPHDPRNELGEGPNQITSLQMGLLVKMVRTLSLRDQFTARHSAAVARYGRAIAQAARCSEEELRTVHTAGLLHDIGKFAFPDRILLADDVLGEGDYEIVRQHPKHGADIVRRVRGLNEIAEIILAHHERIDGIGYPRGLEDKEIPPLARMISVADVYDVMTSRDTYRTPVSPSEAIMELRRVAGTQLDSRYVELFISVLERGRVAFAHTADADFEAELAIEQRLRDLAPRHLVTV